MKWLFTWRAVKFFLEEFMVFLSCVYIVYMYRCDADPVALAKYVVALLRKEKPKSALKELCIDQLEVFLAKGKQKVCK